MKPKGSLEARDSAFRLLKCRVRSVKEMRDRLKAKGFDPAIIEATVDFLKKTQFLDDELFARLWVASRVKKPLGFRRIRQELKLKGIEPGLIEEAISGAQGEFCEQEAMEKIARSKIRQLGSLPPEKVRARLYGLLVRRGFSSQAVVEVIEKLVRDRRDPDR
jgi:regulatory protein